MSDLTPEERAAFEARHRLAPASVWDIPPSGGADDYRCVTCGDRNCDAARLLAALTAAEAEVERLRAALREPQTITFVDEASARRFYAAVSRAAVDGGRQP